MNRLNGLAFLAVLFVSPLGLGNWNGESRPEAQYQFVLKIEAGIACTATALTDRFLLTAAHCFTQFNISEKKLKVENGSNGARSTLRFQKIHFHPKFDLKTVENGGMPLAMAEFDVALIELAEGALAKISHLQSFQALQGFSQSRDFFLAENPADGTLLSLGLGAIDDHGKTAELRRSVPLQVASFSDSPFRASSLSPKQALCLGDSGGPLVLENPSGLRLLGLLSSRRPLSSKADPCEDSRYEYFEVNLAQQQPWIESVLGF